MINNQHEYVLECLSYFKKFLKYDKHYPQILFHGKSAYIVGEKLNGRVEFLNREFNNIVGVDYDKGFEFSSNIDNVLLSNNIYSINTNFRMYCDTSFYINKNSIMEHIDNNYNSVAKLNKMKLIIDTSNNIRFKFIPIKKSISVFESEYVLSNPVRIYKGFRLNNEIISLNALLFCETIRSNLFTDIIKIEINKANSFVRISCSDNNIKVKFFINGKYS